MAHQDMLGEVRGDPLVVVLVRHVSGGLHASDQSRVRFGREERRHRLFAPDTITESVS
jgi:hypothetical protein